MTSETIPALRALGVSVRYGRRLAAHDVSLSFAPRSITAIVGPSGCGKSSFLCALNRLTDLIPDCAVSGSVEFEGTPVLDADVDVMALRQRVGMIFQRPSPFPLSIRRNLDLPLRESGLRGRAEREARIESVLRRVGLWDEVKDRLDGRALALSGGQQQRLCIARALALKPRVLLMDEPTSALDPIASAVIEDLIRELGESLTVVAVTHDLAQARRIADRVGVFWIQSGAGCMIESGPSASVFEQPQHPLTRAYVSGARG